MMHAIKDLDVANKTVLVRCDFNVPMQHDHIQDDTRIRKSLATIEYLLNHQATVILMSHLGRPKEGHYDEQYSLKPIADHLATLLNKPVSLMPLADINSKDLKSGSVTLLENVRFNVGEKANDQALAKQYAALADIFVLDAFGTAHRAQASTAGVSNHIAQKAYGLLMAEELTHLTPLIDQPEKPMLAIIGGSKISTKLSLLNHLLNQVNVMIIGGGMANTFLQALGYPIGASLTENDLVAQAKQLLEKAKQQHVTMGLPTDVVVVQTFSADAPTQIKDISQVSDNDIIVDVGPQTIEHYQQLIASAKTIIWNGPVGIVEWPSAEKGTLAIGEAIAAHDNNTVAGGGDTIAFVEKHGLQNALNYMSTGGGAFLAFLEGNTLPALKALLN